MTLVIAEVIFTRSQWGKERYNKTLNPEPFTATTNKQGFRVTSEDIVYEKDSGEHFRIICLGDSFTYGHGVTDDKTYPVFLEEYLEEIYQKKIQVVNAGVVGATITEELDMYMNNCLQLQHNLVILLFYSGDICRDFMSRLVFKRRNMQDWSADKYLRGLKSYSVIKLKILQRQEENLSNYYDKHKEEIFNQYFERLKSLNKIVESRDALLAVVIFDYPPGDSEPEQLKNSCIKEGILFIDISKEYADKRREGNIYLVFHHNEAGNAFLAKRIAQELYKKNIIKK